MPGKQLIPTENDADNEDKEVATAAVTEIKTKKEVVEFFESKTFSSSLVSASAILFFLVSFIIAVILLIEKVDKSILFYILVASVTVALILSILNTINLYRYRSLPRHVVDELEKPQKGIKAFAPGKSSSKVVTTLFGVFAVLSFFLALGLLFKDNLRKNTLYIALVVLLGIALIFGIFGIYHTNNIRNLLSKNKQN